MTGNLLITAREMLRHALHRIGGYSVITWLRGKRGLGRSHHLAGSDLRSRFAGIYDLGVWQPAGSDTPASGIGSSLVATNSLRGALVPLLERLGAQTVLDVGCGDLAWMQHVPIPQAYIGIDIVARVIEENARRFGSERRRFICLDGCRDELPDADVVICREVMFHLSRSDVARLLQNILSKPRVYLVATTDRLTRFNADIPSGDYRLLNLQAPPFNLPPPETTIDDSAVVPQRVMAVWRADALLRRS